MNLATNCIDCEILRYWLPQSGQQERTVGGRKEKWHCSHITEQWNFKKNGRKGQKWRKKAKWERENAKNRRKVALLPYHWAVKLKKMGEKGWQRKQGKREKAKTRRKKVALSRHTFRIDKTCKVTSEKANKLKNQRLKRYKGTNFHHLLHQIWFGPSTTQGSIEFKQQMQTRQQQNILNTNYKIAFLVLARTK